MCSELCWASGAPPDGGTQQNNAALRPRKKEFEDLPYELKPRVSCEIEKKNNFHPERSF